MENTWSLLFVVTIHCEKINSSPFEVKRPGETVKICRGTEHCDYDEVYWYQERDTETFTLILYIDKSNGDIDKRFNHSQKDDFSAVYKQNSWELQIQKAKLNHSATYYCSCYKSLLLTPVVKPVVSVYPAASRAHLEGKSSLLCLASAMFPPLVQLSWKRQKENGPLEDLLPAEGEQLVIRKSACTAAILLIHQQEKRKYKYRCYVRHEGGPVEAETQQETRDRPPTEHMLTDCFLLTFSHHQIS
uniref:Immunoglobulin heavy variable 6-1 n=1 Tax=Sander lucioperca TaxID=283035 RepID=A0A8C9ZQZ5_SANLU